MYEHLPMRLCTRCQVEKPRHEDFFFKDRRGRDIFRQPCISCRDEEQRERRSRYYQTDAYRARNRLRIKANWETHKKYLQRWREANPERYREIVNRAVAKSQRKRRAQTYNSPGSHTEEEWHQLLEIYGHKCWKCGATESLARDHIVPLSRSGTDLIDNLAPLCKSCNSTKYTATWFPVCPLQ